MTRRVGPWLGVTVAVLVGCSSPPGGATEDAGTDAPDQSAKTDARTPDSGPTPPDAPDDSSWTVEPGCNPLAHRHDCLFPFPSDFFLVDDPSLPSGRRLVLPPAAQIESSRGLVDPTQVRAIDGAPQHPAIFVYLEHGFDDAAFPGPNSEAAANPDLASASILLDPESGELVPHFVEVFQGWRDVKGKLLAVRPLVRLRSGTRYVVALKNLVDLEGRAIEAPDGFREMRDGQLAGAPRWVTEYADRLESDVFTVLTDAGVARDELILAWDFTTASEASVTSDLEHMRSDAIARLRAVPPRLTVDSVKEGEELPRELRAHVHRQIDGFILAVPSYLEGLDGSRLNRDADGRPTLSGNVRVPFTAIIPKSVATDIDQGPFRIVQYGHGFFGSRQEIVTNWQYVVANRLRYVMIAIDWWGFAEDDLDDLVPRLTSNLSEAFLFADRLSQAMVNHIALEFAIREALPFEDAFRVAGRPTFDAGRHYFYGVSGGGIFGGTFAANAAFINRFVLGVGGSSFGLIMSRSDAFGALSTILRQSVGELGSQKIVALAPFAFDPVDPITWAPHISPSSRVLYQVGLGDTAVPTLASDLAARAIGATVLTPSPYEPVSLPRSDGPIDGNGIVYVDFGVDPEIGRVWKPITDDTVAHEGVRRFDPMIEQMDRFFDTGVVVQTCDGACVAGP